MKTGNALLGAFFFWMAFYIPITVITLILEKDWAQKLPVDYRILIFIIFGVFVALGAVSLVFGREKTRLPPEINSFF